MSPRQYIAVAVRAVATVLPFALFGCGQSVTEDRTIHYSGDGKTVAFQHGNEGVYVADKDGARVSKVFQPDETVLATSPPLHSPVDDRLIFLAAERPDGTPRPNSSALPDPPEGRTFYKQPIRYTCWLREAPEKEKPIEPRKLFTVACDDIGYIAAGIGARWSPDGQSIVHIMELAGEPGRHTLYAFDLKTGASRRVFPHSAQALVFEFSPRGGRLVVAGYELQHDTTRLAMWISHDRQFNAWNDVAALGEFAPAESHSLLHGLQLRLPAWTKDESHTARVEYFRGREEDDPGTWLLRQRSGVDGEPTLIQESVRPLRDLQWSADGRCLGYLQDIGNEFGALRVYDTQGMMLAPPGDPPIRRFAGFDAEGTQLAYVVADATGFPIQGMNWSLLLTAAPLARDRVFVTDARFGEPPRELFSGLRITFPRWSPVEKRLSLWLTFAPRYVSIFSLFRNWGLWRGDPAAMLDIETGDISWMAVNAAEELQIGHFHLLKHDYERAWEWYERASKRLPPGKPPEQLADALQQFGAPDRPEVFQYLCLKKLRRDDEARRKLAEFDRSFSTELLQKAGDPAQRQARQALSFQFGTDVNLILQLVRDLYIAEVFLSVDALDEAREFFRDGDVARTREQRLSRALVASQLLLVAGEHAKYLDHCNRELVPLVLEAWPSESTEKGAGMPDSTVGTFSSLALAPLFSSRFIATIPDADLTASIGRWEAFRRQAKEHRPLLGIDLFLNAAHRQLNDLAAATEAEQRIAANPELKVIFPNGDPAVEIEKLLNTFAGWPLVSAVQ